MKQKRRQKVFIAYLGTTEKVAIVPGGSIAWKPGQIRHIRAEHADALQQPLIVGAGMFGPAITLREASKALGVPFDVVRNIANVQAFEPNPDEKIEVLAVTEAVKLAADEWKAEQAKPAEPAEGDAAAEEANS